MSKIYFSADIETNGLIPGLNSMISLGACAIDMESGKIVDKFKINIEPVSDLVADPATMEWWKQFPEAYKRSTENAVTPYTAMSRFIYWVDQYKGQPVRPTLATWKPGFDAAFIRYYMNRFCHEDTFGRFGMGLDIKTLAAVALNIPFGECQIGKVPDVLKQPGLAQHQHDALDDAIEQAYVMYNCVKLLGINL